MFITISIYRFTDGLPVSASSEFSQDKALVDCRRLMKGISLRFQDYQQRCVIHNRGYTIGWYVDNEIGIVGLIDSRTSHGELFYFLKKIAELFWSNYDSNKVVAAQRPFAFIDFDAIIERNRKKFNKRLFDIDKTDLSELENEFLRHPPQTVVDKTIRLDIGKKEGQKLFNKKFHKTKVSLTRIVRLPAPSLIDIVFIIITLGTGGLSFARGHQIATHQWKQWNAENHTSTEEYVHILTFKGTLVLSIVQVFMMLFWFSFRKLANLLNFVLLMVCCFVELDNRHWIVSVLFILVHFLVTVKIHRRSTSDKSKSF